MAYEFTGTFNQSQLDRLLYFARGQRQDLQLRIKHLAAELLRVGTIAFTYDQNGTPTHYIGSPPESYIGRLLSVYEVLGGDAFGDLNLRSKTQPVFLIKADESTPAQLMSNGEVMGQPGQQDAPSAVLVQQLKAWMPDVLDGKRAYLERKIRRMMDYGDQLQDEITLLQNMQDDAALDNIVSQITDLMADKSYRAINDDEGKDQYGKLANAPLLPYSTGGPDAENASAYGRDTEGPVIPGQKEPDDPA